MYRFVNRPIAIWLQKHLTPDWVAPNLISIVAFIFSIIPLIVMIAASTSHMENPSSMKDLPSYVYPIEMVFYYVYLVLDCLDGIHARATGNTSPLGLLVDHGLDTYTAGVVSMYSYKMMQLGCNW
jgi:ethanolaminephosphotransferase